MLRLPVSAAVSLVALPLLAAGNAAALPQDLDVFTSFTMPNTMVGEVFTVGTSPASADFGGEAFAGRIGVTHLYHSGRHAWMVDGDGTGSIVFETNAAEVQFWSRTNAGAIGTTVITAFDDLDNPIGSPVTLTPGDPFQLVSFSGSIDHIDVVNNDSLLNAVDDFGFTPVPEPATFAMVSLGLLALAVCRTRGRFKAR